MQTLKGYLQELIARNSYYELFGILHKVLKIDQKAIKELILIESSFHRIKKKERLRIIDEENANRELNKINYSLLDFLELPEVLALLSKAKEHLSRPTFYKSSQKMVFVGREEKLTEMSNAFENFRSENRTFFLLISGIGGIGKTCLVESFLEKSSKDLFIDKDKIYKIIQGESETLGSGLIGLAKQLELKIDQDENVKDRTVTILRNLRDWSILFLDDVKSLTEIETLDEYIENPVFVIITTQSNELNPFRQDFSRHINIEEFTGKDCEYFFEKNLDDKIRKIFQTDIYAILNKLQEVKNSNSSNIVTIPLFLKLIIAIIKDEAQKINSGRNRVKDRLIKKISELIDKPTTQEEFLERICSFPFRTVLTNRSFIKDILLATSLFDRNQIPLKELFRLVGIDNKKVQDNCREELERWFFVTSIDEDFISFHSVMHTYLIHQFQSINKEENFFFTQRYIQVWLEKLASNAKVRELFPLKKHLTLAIQCFIESPSNDDFQAQLLALKYYHLLLLEKIMPARMRIRFLFRLLEEEISSGKIAFLFALLAESFLRAGKFTSSQSFARQSIIIYDQLGKRMTEEDNKAFLRVLRRLGTTYRSEGKYRESLKIYDKAYEITTIADALSQNDILDVIRQRATTLREIGQTVDALQSLQQAIDRFKNEVLLFYKETSLAYALTTLGGIKILLGKLEEALTDSKEGFNIHQNMVGKKHFYNAYDLRLISKIEIEYGKYDIAIEKLNESYKIYKEFSGDFSLDIAPVYLTMVDALLKKRELVDLEDKNKLLEDATTKAKLALEIYQKKIGENSKYVSLSYRKLAEIAASKGDFDEALLNIQKAKSSLNDEPSAHKIELSALEMIIKLDSGVLSKDLLEESLEIRKTLSEFCLFLFGQKLDIKIEKVIPQINKKEFFLITNLKKHYFQFLRKFEEYNIDNPSIRNSMINILNELYQLDSNFQEKKIIDLILLTVNGNWEKAIEKGWELRSKIISQKDNQTLKLIDRYITYAYLKLGTKDWNSSSEMYTAYLSTYPNSLHNKLGEELLNSLKEEIEKKEGDQKIRILDVFCGSGLISKGIAEWNNPNIEVIGIDGAQKMIELANEWKGGIGNKKNYSFHLIPDDLSWLVKKPFRYVIIHMSWFQIDLRARHFLFQKILPYLSNDCQIYISTYSADFEFPIEITEQYPNINESNNFKEKLFKRLNSVGIEVGSLDNGLTPVFTKENWNTMNWFLELYNFQINPSNPDKIKILKIPRKGEDRVAFTRLPVISNKIFGKNVLNEECWEKIGNMSDHLDFAYGAVFKAIRKRSNFPIPQIFSHVNVNLNKPLPIKYTVAVVLELDCNTMFLMRGNSARDFSGAWSLASTFADFGRGLTESLLDSLKRRLGIKKEDISIKSPLSIRFNLRNENPENPWVMVMCLFKGELKNEPKIQDNKYEEIVFSDGLNFLQGLKSKKMGDCTKSYRDLLYLNIYQNGE